MKEWALPYQVPFRHLCNLIQITDGDIEKAMSDISAMSVEGNKPNPQQLLVLQARAKCAKYWIENCAPEDFRFR
jgi:lysyl-tRNA synthetase class 1